MSRCGPLQQDWRSAGFLRRAGVSGPLSRWPVILFDKRWVRRRVKHPHAVLASNDPQAIVLDVMQPADAVVAEIIPRSGFIERRHRAPLPNPIRPEPRVASCVTLVTPV